MPPRKKFWNFTCCNGYFSAFWIIFSQILFKFFDPNFECFAKHDAFCSHIFAYACLRRKAYCYRKGLKLWKNCIRPTSKTCLRMGGGGMHTPHPTPLDSLLAISYRNHQKSMTYFSHLAPLILFFLLKDRVKRGGGVGMAQCPPASRSLRLGACERIISSFKGG